jgi:hypothetical protein
VRGQLSILGFLGAGHKSPVPHPVDFFLSTGWETASPAWLRLAPKAQLAAPQVPTAKTASWIEAGLSPFWTHAALTVKCYPGSRGTQQKSLVAAPIRCNPERTQYLTHISRESKE